MKHLLITGSTGQLGQSFAAIAKHWPQFRCTFVNKAQLNITDKQQVAAYLVKFKPYAVINCAAFTQVDLAEQQAELAFAVNATGVQNLAQLCKELNIILIHFSTDYVFSGRQLNNKPKQQAYTEADQPKPINQYGASKLAGEQSLLNISPKGVILRTSWLYSQFGHNFVRTISQKIQQDTPLKIVADQIGSPTYAPELAQLCLMLIAQENFSQQFAKAKLLHCAGQGQASWFQLAQEIQKQSQQQTQISAITSQDWPTPAQRPNFSVLNSQKLQQLYGLSLPEWRRSVAVALNNDLALQAGTVTSSLCKR